MKTCPYCGSRIYDEDEKPMPIHTEPYDEKDDQRVFYVLMGWGAMILIILIIALR